MTRRKTDISVSVELGITEAQLARAFNYGPDKFRKMLPALEAQGFPRPHPLLGRYILAEIEAWLARQGQKPGPEAKDPPVCPESDSRPNLAAETRGVSPALTVIKGRLKDGNG